MKCPNCNAENSTASKFCMNCGYPLDCGQNGLTNGDASTAGDSVQTNANSDMTTDSNGSVALASTNQVSKKTSVGKKKWMVCALSGLAVIALIATIAIVATVVIDNGPSDELIKKAIQDEGLNVSKDEWKATDEKYEISNLEVIEKRRVEDTSAVSQVFRGTSTYYKVKAKVTASNGSAECSETVETEFYKDSGESEWAHSLVDVRDRSFTALQGVDASVVEQSVKDEISGKSLYGSIMSKATPNNKVKSTYKDADVKVTEEKFDKDSQTDTVKITLVKDSKTAAAKTTVTAKFSFDGSSFGGGWKLDSASMDEGSDDVDRQGLVGTWTGKFKEQSGVLLGGKCFGAQDRDVILTISNLDNATLKAEGTISFLAHYHKSLSGSNQNGADGDTYLENQSFSTTFENNYNKAIEPNKGDAYASFEFSESSSGKTQFKLAFDDQTGEGSLRITTSTGSFLSPSFFEDTYTLTKTA